MHVLMARILQMGVSPSCTCRALDRPNPGASGRAGTYGPCKGCIQSIQSTVCPQLPLAGVARLNYTFCTIVCARPAAGNSLHSVRCVDTGRVEEHTEHTHQIAHVGGRQVQHQHVLHFRAAEGRIGSVRAVLEVHDRLWIMAQGIREPVQAAVCLRHDIVRPPGPRPFWWFPTGLSSTTTVPGRE